MNTQQKQRGFATAGTVRMKPSIRFATRRLILFSICIFLQGYISSLPAQSVQVLTAQKISALSGNFGGDVSQLGYSAARINDLDGDGTTDVAVGDRSGAVWIFFLNPDGTIKNATSIMNEEASEWGTAIAYLGDLNGDDRPEIAVGAPGDFFGGDRGAVWILSLNSDASVRRKRKIDGEDFGIGGIGVSLAAIGDVNADGVQDLAVGAIDPTNQGDVLILMLNTNATIKSYHAFSFDENPSGGETGFQAFGWSVANIGDLDNDGIDELAVGKPLDNDGAAAGEYFSTRGAVIIVFLNPDGTVRTHQKISDTEGQFDGVFRDLDRFGQSVSSLGDLNQDGIADLAVGAVGGDQIPRNTIWILFLNADGTVSSFEEIDENTPALNGLVGSDRFAASLTNLGDMDGNGIVDLMVGAPEDDDGGENKGAVWTLFLETTRVASFTLIDAETDLPIPEFDPLRTGAVLNLDDLPTHLNIRAHAAGATESVRFDYDNVENFRTENIAPYAMFGDNNGDYANGALQSGTHTLTATPFFENFGLGNAGFSRTISFEVIQDVPEGLVLWNTLGSNEEVLHSKVGPNLQFYDQGGGLEVAGEAGFVESPYGRGVTLKGEYSTFERVHNIVLDNAGAYLDTEQGAVEAWYRQNTDPVANLHNIWRVFGGGFGLGSGIAFQSFDGDFDDRQRFSFQLSFGGQSSQVYSLATGLDGYNISSYNGEWIHLAGVWDRNGIEGSDQTMQLYLNGDLVAASTEDQWGTTVGNQVEICGANDDSAGLFAMDNLKLWDHAKTNFSDRLTEGFEPSYSSNALADAHQRSPADGLEHHPSSTFLSNYPNPFNPTTTIQFSLAKSEYLKLTVHDMLGRKVRTLVDGYNSAGIHEVVFNADALPSGMYFYRLESASRSEVRQMLLLK